MRKRKSIRETKNMIQTALWLPRDMHERLKELGGERGLGDEVRRRLQASFRAGHEGDDGYTVLLLDLIGHAAKILGADEQWHVTRPARRLSEAAISNLLVEISKFSGGDVNQSKLQDKYGANAKPDTIGQVIAHAVLVDRATEALRELGEKPARIAAMSEGHIRRQGDGSWEIKFDLGRDPLTGRRITKYRTIKGTKRKAREELTRLLSQRNEGTYVQPTKMTLAEYLRHWLEADIDRRVAASTAARHRGIVEKNIIPKLGHVPIRKLTATHIEAFEAEQQRDGWVKPRANSNLLGDEPTQPKRALSAQTVQHIHRTFSQALGHAVRQGVLFKNPARQVKPPRLPYAR